jgi:hypothetical protein
MIALVDFGLFILILASAGFLGVVGMALFRELKKGNDNEKPKNP